MRSLSQWEAGSGSLCSTDPPASLYPSSYCISHCLECKSPPVCISDYPGENMFSQPSQYPTLCLCREISSGEKSCGLLSSYLMSCSGNDQFIGANVHVTLVSEETNTCLTLWPSSQHIGSLSSYFDNIWFQHLCLASGTLHVSHLIFFTHWQPELHQLNACVLFGGVRLLPVDRRWVLCVAWEEVMT